MFIKFSKVRPPLLGLQSSSVGGDEGRPPEGSVPGRSWPSLALVGPEDATPAGLHVSSGSSIHRGRAITPSDSPVQAGPPGHPPPPRLPLPTLFPHPPSPPPSVQGISQASRSLSFLPGVRGKCQYKGRGGLGERTVLSAASNPRAAASFPNPLAAPSSPQ